MKTLALLALLLCAGCSTLSTDQDRRTPHEMLTSILATRAPFDDATSWTERAATTPQEVRFDLERLAVRHPEHVPTRRAAGWVAFDHGDFGTARRHADAALALAPHDADSRVLRARLALEQGNLSLARGVLEDGIVLRPDAPQLAIALAGVEFLSGQNASAAAELDRAERLGGAAWQVAYNRGLLAERTGQTMEAITQFETSLREEPKHEPTTWRLRALGVDPATVLKN